jgi:hypothetical protein
MEIISLSELVSRYHHGYQLALQGRDEFIQGALEMAEALFKAKEQITNTKKFSEWLKQNNMEQLIHQDRAALIRIGENLEFSRPIIAQTKRTSYQYIWSKEIKPRLTHVSNSPPQPKAARAAAAPKSKPAAPQSKSNRISAPAPHPRSQEVIDLYDSGKSSTEIEAITGLERQVRHIIEEEELRREGAANANKQISPEIMNLSMQEKFNLWKKQETERMGKSFRLAVEKLTEERVNRYLENLSPKLEAEQNIAKQIMERRKGILTKDEFRELRSCCHPDRIQDSALKIRFESAFRLLAKLEKLLLNEKQSPTQFANIPKTRAEWDAMRTAKGSKVNGSSLDTAPA